MAAPELVQEDEEEQRDTHTHLEVSVTTESPPPPPPPPSNCPVAVATTTTTDHGNNNNSNSSSSSKRNSNNNNRGSSSSSSWSSSLSKSSRLVRSLGNGIRRHRRDYVKISVVGGGGGGGGGGRGGGGRGRGGGDPLPSEWWRTGVALVYAAASLVLTSAVITVVHERVPDPALAPPLPDKFFDCVDRRAWAFTVTEANGLILMTLWFLQWLFLKHRSIVARRCFFLIGTLYLYRCVTMYVTTLPVPGRHMTCAPKLYGDSGGMMRRIVGLMAGGGLSLTGGQLLCGDYLYSGHTVMLTLAYLLIKEYSPPSMWWYHLICWLLSAGGVVCILIGHEHYSIDVVVAYYITSRLFWSYHTMAQGRASSPLSRVWWSPAFSFLERNVRSSVPCVFSWPLAPPPWAGPALHSPCQRYSMVE